jgi:hypothetical protein
MTVNAELGKIWKETLMAYFKILSQNLPGKTKANHKKFYNSQEENLS